MINLYCEKCHALNRSIKVESGKHVEMTRKEWIDLQSWSRKQRPILITCRKCGHTGGYITDIDIMYLKLKEVIS